VSTEDFHRAPESKTSGAGHDKVGYDEGATTTFAAPHEVHPGEVRPARAPHDWHFGADLGLFVLRVTLGALVLAHGLQKVFGLMGGPGISGFAQTLDQLGFQRTTPLAWVTGCTELGAGALLILGLFTPAAAAAVLGVLANAIWVKVDPRTFIGGVELEAVHAAAAFALLFAGAGKISLDRNTPWFRRAPAFGFLFLVIAAGLSVVTMVVLR
jgi:putative oxidoreductase